MQSGIKISIVTINYNGYEDTCDLIESLKRYLTISHEIIVVDNGSTKDEANMLRQRYKHIKVITSKENLGFSGGNNLGIRESKGDYIMLLNNDTIIEDNTFHFMIERMEDNPLIGGVSPKIKFAHEPKNIQFAGYTKLTPITLRNRLTGYNLPDNGEFNTAHSTPYLHGAAMLIRKEIIKKVGFMPEIYFLYYEELDWSSNMTNKGYELWYEPRATVYHKESRTTGIDSPLKIFYLTRNRLIYASRHRKGVTKILSLLYQLSFAATKNILKYVIQGKIKQAKAICEGCKKFVINDVGIYNN